MLKTKNMPGRFYGKKNSCPVVCAMVFAFFISTAFADSPRERTLIDSSWKFYIISAINPVGDVVNSAEVNVTLPLPTPMTLAVGPFTNGQFNLQFPTTGGWNYVVETSTNLLNWTPVFTNTATNGAFIFHDANANDSRRFYRVKQ